MKKIKRLLELLFKGERKIGYLFVLPAFCFIIILVAYPFVLAIYFSLTNKIVGQSAHFVGLRNFEDLFKSTMFLRTARNSFIYTGCAVGLKFLLGMGMALLLNQQFKGRNVLRGLYLLPWVVPVSYTHLTLPTN